MNSVSGAERRFRQWMEQEGWTVRELAERLGVTRQAVWSWAAGSSSPSLLHLAELEKISNGEVRAVWFARDEVSQ
jgi:transcriptional regulator with XRE-family HTH domain